MSKSPESLAELNTTSQDDCLYQKLRGKAYYLLSRREHSACELRRKLLYKPPSKLPGKSHDKLHGKSHDDQPEMVERLLAELAEQNAQSDFRFTEQHCRRRFHGGRGPVKLRYELSQHQIAQLLIDSVMSDYATKWSALAAEVRQRKFGDAPASYHAWAKQSRFLQQRGFTSEHIGRYAESNFGDGCADIDDHVDDHADEHVVDEHAAADEHEHDSEADNPRVTP